MRDHKDGLTQAELDARQAWLDAAPEHSQAYAKAMAAMDAVSTFAGDASILALRRDALAARGDTSVRTWRLAAAFIGLAIFAGAGAFMVFGPQALRQGDGQMQVAEGGAHRRDRAHETYRTAVGTRSSFKLPDGSVATLDTDSIIQADFSPQERTVRLLKGQALFDVAKHKPIPFRVYAGDRCITAVGTQFNVRLDGARLRVTLVEGRVKVSEADPIQQQSPQTNMILTPGEELDERVGQSMLVTRVDLAKVQSWKDGLIVFEDEPLSQAVAELNRYSAKPIAIGDPSISNLRVTGVFNTDQSDRFAQILTETFPLSATYDAVTGAVLRRRAAP
jgi:transmembrane sensor